MRTEREIARVTRCDAGIEDHGCLTLDMSFEGPGWGQGLGRIFDSKSIGPAIRAVVRLFGGFGNLSGFKGRKVWVVRKDGLIVRLEPLLKDEGHPVDFSDVASEDYFMNAEEKR